jgi:acetyl CoA:N6-hydroxylysine acetyl transferase
MIEFQYIDTQKIIPESDIRNHEMIHVFKRCGFEIQTEIDLPNTRAALIGCTRQNLF